jgi:hypothetical protein
MAVGEAAAEAVRPDGPALDVAALADGDPSPPTGVEQAARTIAVATAARRVSGRVIEVLPSGSGHIKVQSGRSLRHGPDVTIVRLLADKDAGVACMLHTAYLTECCIGHTFRTEETSKQTRGISMSVSSAHPRGPSVDRLSRRNRRIVSLATLLGLPAMFAWSSFWATTSVSTLAWGPVTFVLIGLTVGGAFVLYRYTRGRADMPGRDLDERERQLRDQAWILSYQVLSAVVIAGVAVAGISVFVLERPIIIDAALANALVLCIGVLLPVLPAAALAWIEPDAPLDV